MLSIELKKHFMNLNLCSCYDNVYLSTYKRDSVYLISKCILGILGILGLLI